MRRGVRVAAAEVDIYIMTLFQAGSETDSAEALSFPHSPAHWQLQRGDMGRTSAGYTHALQTCTRLQAPQRDVRAKAPYWIPEVPLTPCSQPRPLLSLQLVAFADWEELYCPPVTL